VAKRNKYSRWRRLPAGLSRTSRRQLPDVKDEPRPLTLFLPGSTLDTAEAQARQAGAATVQEYCVGLLKRVLDEQRVREQLSGVEARQGSLEGLKEISNDPEYLVEWNAQAGRIDREEPPLSPPELPRPEVDFLADSPTPVLSERWEVPAVTGPAAITLGSSSSPRPADPPSTGLDRVESQPEPADRVNGPAPKGFSASADIVLRHTGRFDSEGATFLNSLRRGETLDLSAVAELAGALRELEAEHDGATAVDRRLAFALHRLAFEGQVLLTDSWPGAFDTWTVDALRAVQESVDRILSGLDIRYYATDSRPENLY